MNYQEHYTQTSCINWLRKRYPFIGNLCYAVPNGAKRTKAQAAILKSEGMTRGVADICIDIPSGQYHSLRIEMKTPKGTQEPEQIEYQMRCEAVGIRYCIARSFDDFESAVNEHMAGISNDIRERIMLAHKTCMEQADKREADKIKRESRKAKDELHKLITEGRPSSATESARKELRSILKNI